MVKKTLQAFAMGIAIYALLCIALFYGQRSLMYYPGHEITDPASLGLKAHSVTLTTQDGEHLIAWYSKPQPGKATLLFFKGNAGTLRFNAALFRQAERHGMGVLAVSWRGFGGSSGTPTEAGLYNDARAALGFLRQQGIAAANIIYFGESLGTGIAVQLATEVHPRAVVLSAPYTSMADAAGEHYPLFPANLIVSDRYDSFSKIRQVGAPLVILHGLQDGVVPFALGERLFQQAAEPKTFFRLKEMGHVIPMSPELFQQILLALKVESPESRLPVYKTP